MSVLHMSEREPQLTTFGTGWRKFRIKHVARALIGLTYSPDDVVSSGIGTPVLRANNIQNGKLNLDGLIYVEGAIPDKLRLRDGDILICSRNGSRNLIGKNGRVTSEHFGMTFGAFNMVVRSEISEFLYWILQSSIFDEKMGAYLTSTINQLTVSTLNNLDAWIPDLPTQKRIAAFLDRETARIDELISKKERLVGALEAKLRVAITETVTQGIASDAEMADSGVDWIGKIPSHWTVMKLGYLGRCANGINIGGDAFGSGYPFYSYGDVYKNRVLPPEGSGLVQSSESDRRSYTVRSGDVFFTRTSETIEEIGFSSVCMATVKDAVFAGFLIRFRPEHGTLNPLFSKYAFQHSGLRDYFAKEMNLITRASLSQDLLRNMPVALPPLNEQVAIGQHLQALEETILQIIAKTRATIAKLVERRASLITAAVTGQIDVSAYGISAPLEGTQGCASADQVQRLGA